MRRLDSDGLLNFLRRLLLVLFPPPTLLGWLGPPAAKAGAPIEQTSYTKDTYVISVVATPSCQNRSFSCRDALPCKTRGYEEGLGSSLSTGSRKLRSVTWIVFRGCIGTTMGLKRACRHAVVACLFGTASASCLHNLAFGAPHQAPLRFGSGARVEALCAGRQHSLSSWPRRAAPGMAKSIRACEAR